MGLRFHQNWDRIPADEYRHLQSKQLRRFLKEYVLPFSPFYARIFREAGLDPDSFRSLDDLTKIPLTSKEDVAPTASDPQRPRELVLQPTVDLIRRHWPLSRKLPLIWKRFVTGEAALRERLGREFRPVSVFFTTGRSALPTAFVLTNYDLAILQEVGRRIAQVGEIDASQEKILNLFPYAPHLAFWQVYYVGVGASAFALHTGGGKVMGTDGILQALTKIRPAFLVGIPGYVYHLLREAQAKDMDLSFVKGLALGGDRVTPGYRTRVRDLLRGMGAKDPSVGSVLGFTEARKCWTECRGEADAGFHTYPDLEIIEVVDPASGKPVGEGVTGELVYTCLNGRGSCVVRYRTGDLLVGGMTWKPCSHCGRTVPRMSSQLERVSNLKSFQLSKVKGTLVNLNLVKEQLDNDGRIEEWQLIIKKHNDDPFDVDELHLNLALSRQVPESAVQAVRSEVEDRLLQTTEVRLNSVHLLPLPRLLELLGMETQLKEKRIVDLRDGNTAGQAPRAEAAPESSRSAP
jgi:phenylacetate-coenzyme A ligase PaaK-like adenylate-forming protein